MIQEIIFGSVGVLGGAATATVATWNVAKKKLASETDRQKTVLNLAAHSLRSHLNNVLGQSQLLSSRAKSYRSEDQHLIESLLGSSGDVNRILLDVLELVDLDMKKIDIDRKDTLLWDVFRDIESIALRTGRKYGRSVQLEFSESLQAYYHVDSTRICQCVTSLIGQCLTQSEGDKIFVRAGVEKDAKNGHQLVVSVTDPSTKLQQYQANAYFDAKSFRLTHRLGTANAWRLSVLLAKKIANLAGGDVTASADLSKGLTFRYGLPVRFVRKAEKVESALPDANAAMLEELLPEHTRKEHDRERTRLLIVDDDVTNLMILEGLLKSIGYPSVVTAQDGDIAMELVKTEEFDAVITDIQMPNMTGLELSSEIRKLSPKLAGIPIIAASAAATAVDRRAVDDAGINAFIAKPILKDELNVVLKEQLDIAATNVTKLAS